MVAKVDPVRLAADGHAPNDIARHHSPSHLDQSARENEIALEEHDAVDRYLSPDARREPIPVGQVNDVDVDRPSLPARSIDIPTTVEIALELDAIVDDDQQIDVRVYGLFTARPGTERGHRQQVGAEADGRALHRGERIHAKRSEPVGAASLRAQYSLRETSSARAASRSAAWRPGSSRMRNRPEASSAWSSYVRSDLSGPTAVARWS